VARTLSLPRPDESGRGRQKCLRHGFIQEESMDLKLYYQKIRDMESKITEAFPVVVSVETPDGGKAGVLTEVTPGIAAKMLVEGAARLATAQEAKAFRAGQAEAKRAADEAAAAKVQFTVVSTTELNKLKSAPGPSQD
jgi:molybdenum-dependent DNA-binding transcriptional regulator ModE